MRLSLLDLARMTESELVDLSDKVLDDAVARLVMKYHEAHGFSPTQNKTDAAVVDMRISEYYPDFDFTISGGEGLQSYLNFVEYRDKSVQSGRNYGPSVSADMSYGRFVCIWALSIVRHLALERLERFVDFIFSEDWESQLP